jgi:hypothetical protein
MNEDYSTVIDALQDLKKRGYTHEFEVQGKNLRCITENVELNPAECTVDKAYRFEGHSNPSDMSVVYAISSKNGDHKGVLVSAYGTYSEPMTDEMIKLFKSEHRE